MKIPPPVHEDRPVVSTSAGSVHLSVLRKTGEEDTVGRTGADPDVSADDVADLFESLAAASSQFRRTLDRLVAARFPVSVATISQLEQLLAAMRPAAVHRERLARLDSGLLLDGAARWDHRRRRPAGLPVVVEGTGR